MRIRAGAPPREVGAGRPSDGILIEASILARVLGLRLLTLDATITLAPAEVRTRSAVARDRTGHPITPRRASPAAPPRAAGGRLAQAVRTIGEGEQLLEQARRNGAQL
jgi:hypothetical protein